jgi:acyl-coenzyme A thioesterase PaaI-like protein
MQSMTISDAAINESLEADAQAPPEKARPRHNANRHNTKLSRWERFKLRFECKLAELSSKSTFWHRIISWRYLPLAYRSGIKIHKGTPGTSYAAFLPFRRFNRNWYNAMAGGALLGNAEVAGGMFLLAKLGADWTIVCKHLEYDFLRPCMGPAVYRVESREDLDEKVAAGTEFNANLELTVVQMIQLDNDKERERRVGKCTATFHVTPARQFLARKKRSTKDGRLASKTKAG